MGTARRQFTDEFKREAVGPPAVPPPGEQRPAFEPDCPGAGDCPFEAARLPVRIWRLKMPVYGARMSACAWSGRF